MKLLMVSLGCDKNLVDTEFMLGLFTQHGFVFTDDEEEADVIVVNTCCFIHDAKQESIDTILEMAAYKEKNLKALIVCGCLAQRYHDEIIKEIPEVDAVVGTSSYDMVISAINEVLSRGKSKKLEDVNRLPAPDVKRVISTPGHFAYLKIAEGCDKCCTYCIIPKIRGHYRSYPIERLVEEAKHLALLGVKELIVIAQETTVYGVDLYGRKSLPTLLHELCKIDGIKWIRLMYAYPEEIDDDLIECMASEKKILHYVDMPIQHASDNILKKMGRRTDQAKIRLVVEKLRSAMPDICIRTTLITGFPTETQEDHEELYRFVNEMEFDRLGVFTYSCEEDTAAAKMEGQIPEEIKQARYEELMELQQAIVFEKNEKLVGTAFDIIVDGSIPEDGVNVCRTYRDAPDIDGYLFMNSDHLYDTGVMGRAKVIDAHDYDLEGVDLVEFT